MKWLECYNLFIFCLTRLYVIIVCDGCIILDGILGIKNRIVLIFSVIEGTDVVVNSIAGDVWVSEDELTGALSDEVDSGIYYVCKFIQCLCPWRIVEQIMYNGNIMKYIYYNKIEIRKYTNNKYYGVCYY